MTTPSPTTQQPVAPPPEPRQKNVLGLVALIVAIVGFVFACIPGALIVGWILLPVAFILGIVGVALSGRTKGTSVAAIVLSVVGTIVGVIVFVSAVAGAVNDAFGSNDLSSAPSDDTSVEGAADDTSDSGDSGDSGDSAQDADEPAADDTDAEEGTRDNPLAIGQTVSNDDWSVTLGSPHDGTDEVLEANPYNDEPEDGMAFWLVPVEATYLGDDTGMAAVEISVSFVSADGHTYKDYDPGCGVIDDPLSMGDELYTDATTNGDVCLAVPEGADGTWALKAGLFGDPVFFAAE